MKVNTNGTRDEHYTIVINEYDSHCRDNIKLHKEQTRTKYHTMVSIVPPRRIKRTSLTTLFPLLSIADQLCIYKRNLPEDGANSKMITSINSLVNSGCNQVCNTEMICNLHQRLKFKSWSNKHLDGVTRNEENMRLKKMLKTTFSF